MEIRRAGTEDLEALVAIQEAASLAALAHVFPPDRYPFPSDAVRGRWKAAFSDPIAEVLIAERCGAPVGLAFVRPEWLDGLYVRPECWRTSVGPALHEQALSRLVAFGCERAHLWVLEENLRARRFYERRGWLENGRTRVVPYPPSPLDVGYTLELR